MLIGITVMILIVLTLLSVILGENFVDSSILVDVDNTSFLNGSITTYEVTGQDVIFGIDALTGGIAIIVAVVVVASITGVQVLGSGLSPASVKVIITITAYTGLWAVLSILAISLIKSIEVFGTIIYLTITLGYAVGVIQKLSGSDD